MGLARSCAQDEDFPFDVLSGGKRQTDRSSRLCLLVRLDRPQSESLFASDAMTRDEYLAQRDQYLAMAEKAGLHPGTTRRLRTLAADCLALASDPANEGLRNRYVANCRDLDAYESRTGRYSLDGPPNPDVLMEQLADLRRPV
jgi:hypothetical protein